MSPQPSGARLFRALDATWTAAEFVQLAPWTLRRGLGGGKRVSAATPAAPADSAAVARAERAMQAMDQHPIFMIRDGDSRVDELLDDLGYRVVDPVVIFVAPVSALLTINPEPLAAIPGTEPLALMQELWAQGGIGTGRLAVMNRTAGPKSYLFSRHRDSAAGAAFVAVDDEIAMVHALEIAPEFRRAGVARNVMGRAAIWAHENGARHLAAVTTRENQPAQRLFAGLGMNVAAKYHYRIR